MGVDVVDVFGGEARFGVGELHGLCGGFSIGGGTGDMVGVAGGAVAGDFGVDSGAPCFGVLQFFQDQDAGAFAHDKAVPFLIKGNGGTVRVGRAGEGSHVVEARHGEFGDGGFRTACHAGIQIAALDEPEGFAYGVGRGSAGGNGSKVHALEAGADGDVPGGHIADHHGDEENRNPLCAFFEEFLVFLLKGLHPADAAADDDSDPVGVKIL